jgi:ligand-binding sensor domain-containing protein
MLWTGTVMGCLLAWNLDTGEVRKYVPPPSQAVVGGEGKKLAGAVVGVDADTPGELWALYENGQVGHLADGELRACGDLEEVAAKTGAFALTDGIGRKWLTTGKHSGRVCEGGEWQEERIEGDVPLFVKAPLTVDKQGTLWAVIQDRPPGAEPQPAGVAAFDGANWRVYGTEDGLPELSVSCVLTDMRDRKWARTAYSICLLEGDRWRKFLPRTEDQVFRVADLAVDGQGTAWFTSEGKGLKSFDGKHYRVLTDTEELAEGNIIDLIADAKGRVFALCTWGITMIEHGKSRALCQSALPHHSVVDIATDQRGAVWLACKRDWYEERPAGEGICSFDGEQWRIYLSGRELPDLYPECVDVDGRGRVWVGLSGGVAVYDGKEWRDVVSPFWGLKPIGNTYSAYGVDDIACSPGGAVYFACYEGLVVFDGTNWKRYTARDGLPTTGVSKVAVDSKWRVWVITDGEEMAVLENGGWRVVEGGRWTRARRGDSTDGCFIGALSSLAVDRFDRVWVGTWGAGVWVFDGESWQGYNTGDGLLSDHVRAVAVDPRGHPWVGTDKGISHFDGERWRSYTTLDGLAGKQVRAIAIDARGWVWAGTARGLSVLTREPGSRGEG